MSTQTRASTDASETAADADQCTVRILDHDRVESTRERSIGPAEAAEVSALFRVLGDPGRVRMLAALLEAGELCVCDLAAVVDMAESSVSHSLRLLRTRPGSPRTRNSADTSAASAGPIDRSLVDSTRS